MIRSLETIHTYYFSSSSSVKYLFRMLNYKVFGKYPQYQENKFLEF